MARSWLFAAHASRISRPPRRCKQRRRVDSLAGAALRLRLKITTLSPTFVVAAVAEVRNLASRPEVVAAGDTSLEGLRQKTAFVLEELEGRLRLLGLSWGDVTGTQLYTVYDIHPLIASLILPKLGEAGRMGVQWYHAQPPVVGSEIEVDVRATRMELTVNI